MERNEGGWATQLLHTKRICQSPGVHWGLLAVAQDGVGEAVDGNGVG